ncbi:MAG TPA: DUF6785 family protein [Armatimonadota bacterium]|nr:DUF6785 family protein [Armatimonadota bacterium]
MPESPTTTTESPTSPPPTSGVRAITVRAILVGIVMTVLVNAWVEYSELVTPTSQMSESTPPIPAILALGAVAAVFALLWKLHSALANSTAPGSGILARLVKQFALTRHEILAVYLFLIVSCAMPSVGIIRLILPCLMELQYFEEPTNHFDEMKLHIPKHWAPIEGESVRTFWEGAPSSIPPTSLAKIRLVGPALEAAYQFFAQSYQVPWREWRWPFGVWTVYLVVYFLSSFCIVTLFRKKWEEDDHLTFPIASMSVELVRSGRSPGTGVTFFKDPIMWTGFSLAFIYNGLNMLHAFNPSVPAMGLYYPIGQLFTERPWSLMNGLAVWYKPEILGLGYLVPSDIQLSIFVFSMMQWFSRPMGFIVGVQPGGFPFSRQQATGALIILGLYFIYQARGRLADAWRHSWGTKKVDDSGEPLPHRWAMIGAIGGLIYLVAFPVFHGVSLWQMATYIGIGTLFLIAYCRNRGETGLPIVWGYPLVMQKKVMTNFLGSEPFITAANTKSFTLLSIFTFLQRGTYYAITSSKQESCIVGETMGLGARRTAKLVLLATVVGFVISLWMYLASYYTWGGNVMETVGGTQGGQRAGIAMREFKAASEWIDAPSPPNVPELTATCVGAFMTLSLIMARRTWVAFPLHAVGYAFASCHDNYMWFAALVIFATKTIVIRLGGFRLYRRLAPGFIAFTLGHFVSIGIWSFAGLYAGDFVQRYRVWFL